MMIAMIPARMGSQRLAKKNLRELNGVPLITRAIRKCKQAAVFDEIVVNSEHSDFASIAEQEGVRFHQRPIELGNNQATSEQFTAEFFQHHPCEFLFQIHSIAPLLTAQDIKLFVKAMQSDQYDCLLSAEEIQIECMFDGTPINFTTKEKTNSQELTPVQRISWSITGWRRATFMQAIAEGRCATYAGRVGCFPVNRLAGHVIKTEEDLALAEMLLPLVEERENS